MNNWYVLEQLAAAEQQWRLRQAEECQLIIRCSRQSPAAIWPTTLLAALVSYLGFVHG